MPLLHQQPPYASTITAATSPIMKRVEQDLGSLGDLVAPQKISSSPLASTSTTSSFLLDVTSPPEANNKPVKLMAKDVQHEARQQDSSFGSLEDLSFPQKVSSASANASSTATVFELIEHNIPKNEAAPQYTRRPDLSTFFSNLELVNTSNTQNSNAIPMPADMRAVFITLSDAFRSMRQEGGGSLLDALIQSLEADAESPPKEVKGVSDTFLDELDRVPRKSLRKADSCPICGNPFLDDKYPLVVRLPCHKDHIFDLECIAPWLKLHATCPLDRKDLLKKKEPPPPRKEDEEDGEYDEMFA
ncbi:MAG: hypothetical protein L6R41_002198 [Letrouitia leprolyta]|nr:MAG: hypothetical protein L6R41_002198 [Letrouitia leprolyta]